MRLTDCDTDHPTPGYALTKTSDPADGATVEPGDTVTYTLTVTNTSDGVVTARPSPTTCPTCWTTPPDRHHRRRRRPGPRPP